MAARTAATVGGGSAVLRRRRRLARSGGGDALVAGPAARTAARGQRRLDRGDAAGVEGPMAARMTRPRLLFLCQTMPFPPDGGVWIRTYHVIRLLSEVFEITALCFERAATSGT